VTPASAQSVEPASRMLGGPLTEIGTECAGEAALERVLLTRGP
jgi:hypothetical protein